MKKFTVKELQDIYNKHCNLPDEYFSKYEDFLKFVDLNVWEIHKTPGGHHPSNMDLPRLYCILDFKEWVIKHKLNPIKKLLTTANDPEIKFLQYIHKFEANYDRDAINYDLHLLNLKEKDFDFVLFSQTLEHLYNPQLAIENLSKHLKPGGYMFTSVPINCIPHMTPIHFQQFTPMGLATLLISNNYKILEIGQYGSAKFMNYIADHPYWPKYYDIIDENNQIKNDKNLPCHCWVLAKKIK